MLEVKPKSYYTLDPHVKGVEDNLIGIDDLASRVYGKPYSSLRGAERSSENTPNDSVIVFDLENEDNYLQALDDFDAKEIYLGYDFLRGESHIKKGMTQLEYWLTITWDGDPSKQTVNANPPEWTDLTGAVFPSQFFAERCFTPDLGNVIADLIRREELPRGNYIFRHWC